MHEVVEENVQCYVTKVLFYIGVYDVYAQKLRKDKNVIICWLNSYLSLFMHIEKKVNEKIIKKIVNVMGVEPSTRIWMMFEKRKII